VSRLRGRVNTIFGSTAIPSQWCPECKSSAFVIDGRMACCDLVVNEGEPKASERRSISANRRIRPAKSVMDELLSEQEHRCFWCGSKFGDDAVAEGRKKRHLTAVWDHVEPYCWQHNNAALNFVAACAICNGIKGSKMFPTIEACRDYVWRKRERKGWASATQLYPARLVALWRGGEQPEEFTQMAQEGRV